MILNDGWSAASAPFKDSDTGIYFESGNRGLYTLRATGVAVTAYVSGAVTAGTLTSPAVSGTYNVFVVKYDSE
jgi:hypothetical protein